jgi:hypothetical protein
MGTGSFPGVESGRGMTQTSHPLLVPRSKNRVELYFYPPYGPLWPVKEGENYLIIQEQNGMTNFKITIASHTNSISNSHSTKKKILNGETVVLLVFTC